MTKKINLVFMGGFAYPSGMAGTKRIQHAIKALRKYPDVTVRVIVQRQSSRDNILSGIHEGTPYQTVMADLLRAKVAVSLPLLYFKTIRILKDAWNPNHKNIIYHYGPVHLENLVPLYYSRYLGYKIVFDIVEDYDVAKNMSSSFYYRTQIGCITALSSRMQGLASGIVVISSHLETKYSELGQGRIPIHFRAVSVDMDCFPIEPSRMNSTVSLFYAGSFGGKKEGLSILLDAFDRLAERRKNIRLVLTGKGDSEAMKIFFSRVEASPYKGQVEYMGYLDDNEYYSALNSADIPCMTRIDYEYTNAGFPFKLGEFLATGKPVIASQVSDIHQFLVNRQNAMLVRPGDSDEIFKAAEYLMDNPEDAKAIGMRGREAAESFFDHKQQGKALLAFLESI
jgi:glycosyltransferase involved in cell wall biosynthesis